jgi:hypothetical protein
MRIGLVGEAPNDTASIINLLEKRYSRDKFHFFTMLDTYNGSNLDSARTFKILKIELKFKNPDLIIFIRDLDGNLPSRDKMIERKRYFKKCSEEVNGRNVNLLHIWEIEALIFTDPEVFNVMFNAKLQPVDDVSLIVDPKGELMKASKKYRETKNADIFKKLNFNKVLECNYFSDFINNFNAALEGISQ